MQISRRRFIGQLGVGLGAFLIPIGSSRVARAMSLADGRTLVVLFVRGGWDGINLVVPRGDEANYLALRQNDETGQDITLPPAPELALDDFFELHPSLAPLLPRYHNGELAVVHAVGGTGNYSHFTAQDAMERAETVNPTMVADGWLHRTLLALQAEAGLDAPVLTLSGVAIAPSKPKSIAGPESGLSLAMPSLASFAVGGEFGAERGTALDSLYRRVSWSLLGSAGTAAFDAMGAVEGLADQPPDASYPSGGLGDTRLNTALQDAARLIKNPDLGVKAITLDYGGWDHHTNELNRMQTVGTRLAGALAAFQQDLGSAADRTLVLVASEFGRTAFVNGNGGTDHGWGTLMLALGGGIRGGRVLTRADDAAPGTGLPTPSGHWPGLGPGELHVQRGSNLERDLKSTTDFRDVFGEVLVRFLGLSPAVVRDDVLRGFEPRFPGLFAGGGGPRTPQRMPSVIGARQGSISL